MMRAAVQISFSPPPKVSAAGFSPRVYVLTRRKPSMRQDWPRNVLMRPLHSIGVVRENGRCGPAKYPCGRVYFSVHWMKVHAAGGGFIYDKISSLKRLMWGFLGHAGAPEKQLINFVRPYVVSWLNFHESVWRSRSNFVWFLFSFYFFYFLGVYF